MQQPLERTPGRMHLDGAFEPAVVRILHIRVTPADMRDDDRVLAFQRTEQRIRGVDRVRGGLAFDQDVRRTAYRPTFVAVKDVAVAPHAGIAGPFVARKTHELAGL